MNKKKVTFSNLVQVREIPPKHMEPRGMMKYLTSGALKSYDIANIKIMNILNRFSKHKIIIVNQEEVPFKIYSKEKEWYEDDTPILIVSKLKKNQILLFAFINEYNIIVNKHIEPGKSSFLEYRTKLGGHFIKIDALVRN